jgi:crossover junction endodeoxyribonuclease RusA
MIKLNLEYPPSVNQLWRAVPGRGVIKSKVYRIWLEKNLWIIRGQTSNKILGKFTIEFEATRPDKRRRDIDNLIKPLMDVIVQAGLVEDDSLCEMLSIKWTENGTGISATILPLSGTQEEILPVKAKHPAKVIA